MYIYIYIYIYISFNNLFLYEILCLFRKQEKGLYLKDLFYHLHEQMKKCKFTVIENKKHNIIYSANT